MQLLGIVIMLTSIFGVAADQMETYVYITLLTLGVTINVRHLTVSLF